MGANGQVPVHLRDAKGLTDGHFTGTETRMTTFDQPALEALAATRRGADAAVYHYPLSLAETG
jgi:hypothetical protein